MFTIQRAKLKFHKEINASDEIYISRDPTQTLQNHIPKYI